MHRLHHQHTWLGSDRASARFIGRPVTRFLAIETSGGALLLAATLVALIWANSPWSGSYATLWSTEITFGVGSFRVSGSLVHWVNDALMALFFFVAGLEIKRELVHGELRNPRAAALPVIGAVGGMIVPATLFLALNSGAPASHGWGIPVATDIAFAVGVVTLLGRRCPPSLKLFLLTLAIADDLGGIIMIALFYAGGIQFGWLAGTAVLLGAVYLMRRAGIWYMPLYLTVGIGVWITMYQSGVHATVAGVLLGLLCPTRALNPQPAAESIADSLQSRSELTAADVRSAAFLIQESVSVDERLVDILHPWTSYVIVPVFALANAGVQLSSDALREAVSSTVTLGVVIGLVVGKTIGVFGATWIAARIRVAVIPDGVTPLQMLGASMAAGVGFTVALFVTELAFGDNQHLGDLAKLGILAASMMAAALSAVTFVLANRRAATELRARAIVNSDPPDPRTQAGRAPAAAR